MEEIRRGMPIVCLMISCFFSGLAGWWYGEKAFARGVRLTGRLSGKSMPGVLCLLLFFIVVNAAFFLNSALPELNWRLPLLVERYQSSVRLLSTVCVLSFCFALTARLHQQNAGSHTGKILGVGLLLILVVAGTSRYIVTKHSVPVQLASSRMSSDGFILQSNGSTCAAASGANFARHFGFTPTEAEMASLMGTTKEGTMDSQIVDGLAKLGLIVQRRFVPDKAYQTVKIPALMLVDYSRTPSGHCVLYLGEQNGKVEILDPLSGKVRSLPEQFKHRWTGWTFELKEQKS